MSVGLIYLFDCTCCMICYPAQRENIEEIRTQKKRKTDAPFTSHRPTRWTNSRQVNIKFLMEERIWAGSGRWTSATSYSLLMIDPGPVAAAFILAAQNLLQLVHARETQSRSAGVSASGVVNTPQHFRVQRRCGRRGRCFLSTATRSQMNSTPGLLSFIIHPTWWRHL